MDKFTKRVHLPMQNLPASQSEKLAALRRIEYFVTVSEFVLIQLCQGVCLRRYERGEMVFWEGDPCAGLYSIQLGSVKLFKTSPQGRELIIKVFEEGATFNEVPVMEAATR